MLLPSALTCESRDSRQSRSSQNPPVTRLQSAALFTSPPASPPQLSTQNAIGNIFTTCRSLQSLLAASGAHPTEPSTPPTSSHSQLPTPPMTHAPSPPPLKLRLRSRKPESTCPGTAGCDGGGGGGGSTTRKRIAKRSAPARGPNKRRRPADDDMGREGSEEEDEVAVAGATNDLVAQPGDAHQVGNEQDGAISSHEPESASPGPQTPKRARIAPEVVPLGLERADYHALHAGGVLVEDEESRRREGTDVVVEEDGERWSAEDDRVLVELVLEKLKLSKSDWQDCARSLGRDRASVGRRWKSLVASGDIGPRRNHRRGKIHGTWR